MTVQTLADEVQEGALGPASHPEIAMRIHRHILSGRGVPHRTIIAAPGGALDGLAVFRGVHMAVAIIVAPDVIGVGGLIRRRPTTWTCLRTDKRAGNADFPGVGGEAIETQCAGLAGCEHQEFLPTNHDHGMRQAVSPQDRAHIIRGIGERILRIGDRRPLIAAHRRLSVVH